MELLGGYDQGNVGQVCAIPYGNETLCPVKALLTWRERVKGNSGYVFCRIGQHSIGVSPLNPNQINSILKSIAIACELPHGDLYSSHSLRRGFAAEASRKGAPFGTIMRQGRWRHEGTVLGYIDEGKRFVQNAAEIVLRSTE